MIVYIIMKETKINEYSSTITEVEKSFKNKEDAYSYLLSRVSEEEENRKKYEKCNNCEADFEKEFNPECYESDNIDPECVNYISEYPKHKYWMKEIEVIENSDVDIKWRKM